MSGWRDVSLVAGREIRQRLRGKWFIVSTIALVVLILGAGVGNRLARGDDGPAEVTVLVLGTPPAGFARALRGVGSSIDLRPQVRALSSLGAGRAALDNGDADVVLDVARQQTIYAGKEDRNVQGALQQAWSISSVRARMVDVGLTPNQIDRVFSAEPLHSRVTDPEESGDGVGNVVGMFAGILLFLALQTYGSFILMGVVEEKSSAVIEVLLGRVNATRLLTGKVLGIGAIALAQFAIAVVAGVGALAVAGVDVPGSVWTALPWAVIWFLGGFALYAFLFALAGSLVSRQEDAQSAVMPIAMVLLIAYFAVFLVAGDPGAGPATVLSLVPPFAPLLMPLRIATGTAAWYEIALSLALLVVAVVASARLTGRIYTRMVLRRGARTPWMEALRSTS